MAVLNVLVVNAGSTSLKLSLLDRDDRAIEVGALAAVDEEDVDVVVHRVVHGGERFVEPVIVDDEVLADVSRLAELAPLHNQPALEAIAAARRVLPARPHVAVFDTAFHASLPPVSSTYALPASWRARGLRRYGFHGLSVQWAAAHVPVARLVVCHLGGGSSITAVRDGRSMDTTMGMTPLEGVPMATRSGSVDPGLLLHLLRHGLSVAELEDGLERRSGLLGLSEQSPHLDEVERAMAAGEERARLALEVYTRKVAQSVASMAVAVGGVDALVFTGGVGEHSVWVRERVCTELAFIGVRIDADANARLRGEGDIGIGSVRVVVVQSREDIVMARAARAVVGAATRR
jgi:acetate kinase